MRQAGTERGGLAVMAAIVLASVALLGYATGWMHVRGADIVAASSLSSSESSSERLLDGLIDLGLHAALTRDQFEINASCDHPQESTYHQDIADWGQVDVAFHPEQNGVFQITITGTLEDATQRAYYCKVACPTGATCPGWMTPAQCAGGGGGGTNMRVISCSL